MPLTRGTVLVAALSASDDTDGTESDDRPKLQGAEDQDGAIGVWLGKQMHFFAFHNAAHMRHPFVMRIAGESAEPRRLDEAPSPAIKPGRWHEIEVGRSKDQLWLRIDDKAVVEATDPKALLAGHLALRIRGTSTQQANCLIRDVRALTPGDK
jgi:hypothetical protein